MEAPVILAFETPYDTEVFTPLDDAVVSPLLYSLAALRPDLRLTFVFRFFLSLRRNACDHELFLAPEDGATRKLHKTGLMLSRNEERRRRSVG